MEACASPVKLIHVLWSLEYTDPQGISVFNRGKTHFLQLENSIGQFPFSSPTVFNFLGSHVPEVITRSCRYVGIRL